MTTPPAAASALPSPLFEYAVGEQPRERLVLHRTEVLRVTCSGRSGWLLTDPRGGILLGPHHLDAPSGTLILEVLPTERLATATRHPRHLVNLPRADEFTLISDRHSVHDSLCAHFSITWHSGWHPGFWVKRFPGELYRGYRGEHLACAAAGHLALTEIAWHEIAYVWTPTTHRLYVNGVLVATESRFNGEGPPAVSPAGPRLHGGNALIALGRVTGYERALEPAEIDAHFRRRADPLALAVAEKLVRTYTPPASPAPLPELGEGWTTALDLSLDRPEHLDAFLVQGCPQAPSIDAEGLRLRTPDLHPRHGDDPLDLNQVYLWTRQIFRGDLHASFDFKTLRRGGLSLALFQASGMQGEDFVETHPPRLTGSMGMVCWEDVRNYHWEFYREMNDVRNDLATHAIVKNPWFHPLAFQVAGPLFPLDTWRRVEFVQRGEELLCAIDGRLVLQARDSAVENNGPVLSRGRVALRAMIRSDVRFRHLRIRQRPRDGLVFSPA